MKLIHRVYYSIIKNIKNSLLLFLIVFIIGNVICSSLAITQSINNTQAQFRIKYGAKVEINSYFDIATSMILDYGNDPYAKKAEARIKDKIVENSGIEFSYLDYNYYLNGLTSNTLGYMNKEELLENISIHICGVTNPQMGLFKNYKLELKEGRSFTDEELTNGNKVVLISENFKILKDGKYEKVKLKDKIVLENNQEKSEYEVIGIYKRYDNVMIQYDEYDYNNHIARLYVPYNTLIQEETDTNKAFLGNVYLQIKDNDQLKALEKKIDAYIIDDDEIGHLYSTYSMNEIYRKIAAPIESMSGIANFLFISSSTLCILILTITVFIMIRKRVHEIGILISLGESRLRVLFQIFLEIYLVCILGLSSSMISGNQLGKIYSDYLIVEQVESSKEDLSIDEIKLQDELMENYSFEMSIGYISAVLIVGSLVLGISVILPIGYISRLNVKKILL